MITIDFGFVSLFERLVSERVPFRATMQMEGTPQRITIALINHTKDTPLFIHAVRVHFGTRTYNHFFHLSPYETVQISCRAKSTFTLEGNPVVGRFREQKTLPDLSASPVPSFDSPRDLFRAISYGKPRDSWLETDFNEFDKRRFFRGKVQPFFKTVYDTLQQS